MFSIFFIIENYDKIFSANYAIGDIFEEVKDPKQALFYFWRAFRATENTKIPKHIAMVCIQCSFTIKLYLKILTFYLLDWEKYFLIIKHIFCNNILCSLIEKNKIIVITLFYLPF